MLYALMLNDTSHRWLVSGLRRAYVAPVRRSWGILARPGGIRRDGRARSRRPARTLDFRNDVWAIQRERAAPRTLPPLRGTCLVERGQACVCKGRRAFWAQAGSRDRTGHAPELDRGVTLTAPPCHVRVPVQPCLPTSARCLSPSACGSASTTPTVEPPCGSVRASRKRFDGS